MCVTCVAEGTMYVGGAAASLRVLAHRASSRRARGLLPPLGRPDAPDPADRPDDEAVERFSTGTPHL